MWCVKNLMLIFELVVIERSGLNKEMSRNLVCMCKIVTLTLLQISLIERQKRSLPSMLAGILQMAQTGTGVAVPYASLMFLTSRPVVQGKPSARSFSAMLSCIPRRKPVKVFA
jgi:hypothetical protein